jgi:hypothetical protein
MIKRGELTSAQIVGLVLLIAGFIIVFIFLSLIFDTDDLTDRELCRLSVIERATVPQLVQNVIPLKCATDKVCITTKRFGGECKQFAGDDNVRNVRIDLDEHDESVNLVERESANAMFDCWRMMGEGKLGIFPPNSPVESTASLVGLDVSIADIKPKCVVCSRLAISEDVSETGEGQDIVNDVDINNFLENELVPGSSLTYLQTFTDPGVRSYVGADEGNFGESDDRNVDQLAFVFMQMITEVDPGEAAQDAALGSLIFGGGGALGVKKVVSLAVRKFTGLVGLVVTVVGAGVSAGFSYNKAKSNQLVAASYCGEFESRDDQKKLGCSIVQGISWDVDTLKDLCKGGIEGNF